MYSAVGPPPCRSIWRYPWVLGLSGTSRAATPEPDGRALIGFVLSPVHCTSTAAAGAAAVLAFVACAVRHHQHAALAARRRALVRVSQLRGGQRHLHGVKRGFIHWGKGPSRSGR